MTQDLDVLIATSSRNYVNLASALGEIDARILSPEGEQSTSVPSATLLGGSEQWHLISRHGRLDVLTTPAHLGSFEEIRSRAHTVRNDVVVLASQIAPQWAPASERPMRVCGCWVAS